MSIFKTGDVVYHYEYGKGEIYNILETEKGRPIKVRFENKSGYIAFTIDGKDFTEHSSFTLSFTPYDLIKGGFSQERPKPEIEKGTVIYGKTHNYWVAGRFNCWGSQGDIGIEGLDGITTYFSEYSLENPLI